MLWGDYDLIPEGFAVNDSASADAIEVVVGAPRTYSRQT